METVTTIRKMMAGNTIIVPTYQRAYAWDTPRSNFYQTTHIDVFIKDIEECLRAKASSPYYFGHFLFEEKQDCFHVIDGQQRLTTIVIFLSALFARLKALRELTEDEEICYEDMIKRKNKICFSTVDYDNQFFKDFVIDQTKKDSKHVETESARRISRAFEYFKAYFKNTDEATLSQMLKTVSSATCTTHRIESESEAIQMFIFQNGRGKKPSNLEIIKAQFMYAVHMYGDSQKQSIIDEIKNRFENIYKSISSIEYRINEDDVLVYTLRVYFNSLWESNSLEKINKCLEEDTDLSFVRSFTQSLANSFDYLSVFFGSDEKKLFAVHSLVTLGNIGIALPFIIKAYTFDLEDDQKEKLCTALERIVLRHRLIGTRAELTSRLNPDFQTFTEASPSIQSIVDTIQKMTEAEEGWWAYWNDEQLAAAAQNCSEHSVCKYILWKYEHFLGKNAKKGYAKTRFEQISDPNLEHISPKQKPDGKNSGYGKYDDTFYEEYLDCLGNYLLLSGSHNKSISNAPFLEKIKTYKNAPLLQQQEVYQLGRASKQWKRKEIKDRNKKIVEFIMQTF